MGHGPTTDGVTNVTGVVLARAARIRRLIIRAGAAPGTLEIRDGGASGTVKLTLLPLASVSSQYDLDLELNTDVHFTLGANITDVYWEIE